MRTAPQLRLSKDFEDPTTSLRVLKREIDSKLNPFLRDIGQSVKRHDMGLTSSGNGAPIPTPGGPFFLLPGRFGGQIGYGATESGGSLRLRSTAHSTKGLIYLGSSDITVLDDVNNRLGMGTLTPAGRAHIKAGAHTTAKGKPNSFISTDATKPWTNPFSGTIPLVWDTVDEENWPGAGDTTWCQTNGGTMTAGSYSIELGINDVPFFGNNDGWVLTFSVRRVNAGAATITCTANLRQGSGLSVAITTLSNAQVTSAFQQFSYTLLTAETASMAVTTGFFRDLRIRVTLTVTSGTFNAGGTEFLEWGWGQLQAPGSGGTDVTALILENNSSDDQALLELRNGAGNGVKITAPSAVTTHTLTMPGTQGAANSYLKNDGTGILSWDTGVGSHKLLDGVFNNDTDLHTVVLGDIIAGNSTPHWQAVAGNTTATRKFLRQTGNGSISALPAWDTILAADVPGSALTKTDDTNVTLTLGGSPNTALLAATSLTLGWTGTLAIGRGGTGAGTALAAFNALSPLTTRGDLLTRDATNNVRLALGTAKQVLAVNAGATDAAWASLDNTYLADRLRHIWLPPNVFSQSNGTASTLQAISLSATPKAVVEYNWVDAPAVGPQAFTTQFIVPQDYVSGTTIQVFVHWSELTANLADLKWVCRYSCIVLGNKENMNGTWTGPTAQIIVDNGATGSGGDYDVGVANYHAVKQFGTDIPSTGLAAGKFVILTMDRLSTDVNDTLNKTVEFLGIELRYTADM
jgi:hypothetical protein